MASGSTLRDQIAARRAAARGTTPAARTSAAQTSSNAAVSRGFGQGGSRDAAATLSEGLEDKTVAGQIKRASKNGKLDISSLNLDRIPAEVYTELLGIPVEELSDPPAPEAPEPTGVKGMTDSFSRHLALAEQAERDAVFNKAARKGEWVEPEAELVTFNAEGNGIEVMEREIGAFGGLKSFNLSNNRISVLPESFADLLRITTLSLAHNAFTALPPALLLLPKLEVLDLSHNALTTLDLSSPVEPSDEGLSYGAGFLSTSFSRQTKASKEIWPVLRHLNLGHNRLSADGLRGLKISGGLKAMRVVNLESNALEGEVDVGSIGVDASGMPQLASLVLNGNGYLRGVKGEMASGCKVELDGTGTFSGSRPTQSTSSGNGATQNSEAASSSTPPPDVPKADLRLVYRTLPAATFDSLPLEVDLDLYLPPTPSASKVGHPLVVWFHGGGLLQGNKENLPPHFRRIPQTPFGSGSVAVVSANYRLAPQVPIIDILSDITALMTFVQTRLNERIFKAGKGENRIDTSRICLSGGSAGGYLALIAGLEMPQGVSDEEVGGYRGEKGIKCIAPFYPITDMTDPFWSTETNPVPWMNRSIPQAEAKPHLDLRAAPICTTISGGPRSILYPYMLQHSLFPSLLFMNQRSIGSGLDGFRPSPETLSITSRLPLIGRPSGRRNTPPVSTPPIYFAYGGKDDKVQPMEKTLEALKGYKGSVTYEFRPEGDHQFDEDPSETCEAFRKWLGETLI